MRFERLGRWAGCTLVTTAMALTACGANPDAAYDWTGNWEGTATVTRVSSPSAPAATDQGAILIVLFQSGLRVSGTWAISFPSRRNVPLGGSLSGTVTDTTLTATLSTLVPVPCALSTQASRSDGVLTGSLRPDACPALLNGSFSLAKT
jgi:hypothetical protein